MVRSLFFKALDDGFVKCLLCPNGCIIGNNGHGICNVRANKQGILYSENYGKLSAIAFDPIEKKPLYHFYPGSKILSIGSLGCTMKCPFCQNHGISQVTSPNYGQYTVYEPETIVKMALGKEGNIGIAFTYNEPTTFYEYMLSTAKLASPEGLKTVMATNGYINQEPLEGLLPFIDAFNVDLKAFSDSFYQSVARSELVPVKKTVKRIAVSRKHLEITNLVIPGLNDNLIEFEEMARWIAGETGDGTVLHISRYFPNYQLKIGSTPVGRLFELCELAKKHLKYVYIGNIADIVQNTTYCDKCGNELIVRWPTKTMVTGLDKKGDCDKCGYHVLDHIGPGRVLPL